MSDMLSGLMDVFDNGVAMGQDGQIIPEQGAIMAEGIQIVSDGTVEGTRVMLDGYLVQGNTEARWRFNARSRSACLVLELTDIKLDVSGPPVDAKVSEALEALIS